MTEQEQTWRQIVERIEELKRYVADMIPCNPGDHGLRRGAEISGRFLKADFQTPTEDRAARTAKR
jgi:hypothetical protein